MMLPARGAHNDGVPMQRTLLNPNTKRKKAHSEGERISEAFAGVGCLVVSVWVPQRDGLGESERLPPAIMTSVALRLDARHVLLRPYRSVNC